MLSELSRPSVGCWAGCGKFGANAESGVSGPLSALEPLTPMLSPSTPSKPPASSTTFAPGVSPVNFSLISL